MRLDARVKTELPTKVLCASQQASEEDIATITELSLSGALLNGVSAKCRDILNIKPDMISDEDIEIPCEVVRADHDNAAVRFYLSDTEVITRLWNYIKSNLHAQTICPYCGNDVSVGTKSCSGCRRFLDFSDGTYLEKHFRETFSARILSRINGTDFSFLSRIISAVEREHLKAKERLSDIEYIGTSPSMLDVFSTIRKVAPTEINVLILGESGTGKELTAQAIHERSQRKVKPFVVVNCAAIPEGLLEAELFGYERGSFTGAYNSRKGKFESADGGTLFLDEIGDLSLSLQAKLLRFLEDRVVERIGSKGGRKVDVRIIAATNSELETSVNAGHFRNDLFFRLNAFTIKLPSLRERDGDKVILAKHFFRKIARANGCNLKGFSAAAIRSIGDYDWPGNVRELINKVRRGIVMAAGDYITPDDMELSECLGSEPLPLKGILAKSEKEYILRVLEENGFVISRAARSLCISRQSLYSHLKKHGISPQDMKKNHL